MINKTIATAFCASQVTILLTSRPCERSGLSYRHPSLHLLDDYEMVAHDKDRHNDDQLNDLEDDAYNNDNDDDDHDDKDLQVGAASMISVNFMIIMMMTMIMMMMRMLMMQTKICRTVQHGWLQGGN